VQAVA